MRLPLLQVWRGFRSSYWFLPSVMVALAIVLGAVAIWLDSGPASKMLDGIGWYQKSKPEGAREVLSTIAGSMITVAGVVFSITVVAISFAANQYGPRILTNFMSDRGNQVTLGTFIATFVYSIVVLRTIHGGDSEFVPQLSVMLAMVLALCSILVLIYFIHHVPESIHINTITARVGRELIASIDKRFPAHIGDPPGQPDKQLHEFSKTAEAAFGSGQDARAIDAQASGYVQAIDDSQLLHLATENDLLVSVAVTPGQFVYAGRPIAHCAPGGGVTDKTANAIRSNWAIGSSRTPDQDLMFLIDELVEIAARALSTGVNDPYTAMTCTDWLTAAAAQLARRHTPSPYRLDPQGKLRVIAPTGGFGVHLDRGFGRLRPYAAGDVNAAVHFLSSIALLAGECRSDEQADFVSREAEALFDLACQQHDGASLDRIELQMALTRAAIRDSRLTLDERSKISSADPPNRQPASR